MNEVVTVIGLGYVGLPVAVALSGKYRVVGFDINQTRIKELQEGHDRTREIDSEQLKSAQVSFTSDPSHLEDGTFHIVTVPTPIDEHKRPDLSPLRSACETLGKFLKSGDVVVFESTVYPGATEEVCMPILDRVSGLKGGVDYKLGYSPERINPGDKEHSFTKITKVVSAQDEQSLGRVCAVYGSVVEAGLHPARSIKVAEAAKVIENTQRDLNIALINELAMIFDKMDLDTRDVLEAAQTKWNFLRFWPGLVGGHCIGVDPYYLTFKAESIGHDPAVILSGRSVNDSIPKFIVDKVIKLLIANNRTVKDAKVGILGLSFKENCPDLRNSKVKNIIEEFKEYSIGPIAHDPGASSEEALKEFSLEPLPIESFKEMDVLVFAVGHDEYKDIDPSNLKSWFKNPDQGVVVDIKGLWSESQFKDTGLSYWRL